MWSLVPTRVPFQSIMYTWLRFWFVCVCVIGRMCLNSEIMSGHALDFKPSELPAFQNLLIDSLALPFSVVWLTGAADKREAEAGTCCLGLTPLCETEPCPVFIFPGLNSIWSVMPFGCRTALVFLLCSLVSWQAGPGLLWQISAVI